ncbi:MAG: SGNH/GDSL hydrolase family protein [Gemmatimonadales bacterium]
MARNLALAGGALVVSLLLCELLLRLVGIEYPVYVWTDPLRGIAHIPGSRGGGVRDGRHWIEINHDGMRGPDIPLEHPPGTLRIALLGDSFIEAFEVAFDSTVGQVLARRLSALRGAPVEVLNFGVGGYGTTQELLTLRAQVWKYTPDLVLLAVTTGNDITDNYRPLSQDSYRPYYVYRGQELVLDTSFLESQAYRSRAVWTRRLLGVVRGSSLVQLINRVRHASRRSGRQQQNMGGSIQGDELGLRDEVQLPPATADWREAWRVTEGVLRMMRDECRGRHTPFALVTLTRGTQVTPVPAQKASTLRQLGVPDLYYPERRLADFGRHEGISVLNLAPTMAVEAEQRQVYFHALGDSLGIGHWNSAGHRAAGNRIAEWLALDLAGSVNAPAAAR